MGTREVRMYRDGGKERQKSIECDFSVVKCRLRAPFFCADVLSMEGSGRRVALAD